MGGVMPRRRHDEHLAPAKIEAGFSLGPPLDLEVRLNSFEICGDDGVGAELGIPVPVVTVAMRMDHQQRQPFGMRVNQVANDLAQRSLGRSGLLFSDALPLLEGLLCEREWISTDVKHVQSLAAERGLELPVASFDVQLAAFLLDPSATTDVSAVSIQYLGRGLDSWEDLAGRGAKAIPAGELPVAALAVWAARHVCAIRELVPVLAERLEADGLQPLFSFSCFWPSVT